MKHIILFFLVLTITSCTTSFNKRTRYKEFVTVMTFNVENLFDNIDDKNKSDETYLPLAKKKTKAHKEKCRTYRFKKWQDQCLNWDWSEEVLTTKLKRLGNTIKQINNGMGPDVLILQEVENKRVLERLNKEQLLNLKYKEVILIEGRDKRGIDIAILSRLERIGKPRLHYTEFKGFPKDRVEDTRGILQADFLLSNNEVLTVYGVHFPAPFHPVEMREQAFLGLNKLKNSLPKDRLVIAAGDFNVPSREDKKTGILTNFASKDWLISHKIGCEDCKGTNYFAPKDSWSFLDMILLSHNFSDERNGWQVIPSTIRVANRYKHQVTEDGKPKRFKLPEMSGVSDHWPLVLKIGRVE